MKWVRNDDLLAGRDLVHGGHSFTVHPLKLCHSVVDVNALVEGVDVDKHHVNDGQRILVPQERGRRPGW